MKNSILFMTAWILSGITFSFLQGCKTTRHLEEGGAYTDVILYQADQTIAQTVAVMEDFQEWAKRNPAYIATNQTSRLMLQKVNKELDGIAEPDEILVQAVQARDLFEMTLSERDLSTLNQRLIAVNQLARAILPILFPDGEI